MVRVVERPFGFVLEEERVACKSTALRVLVCAVLFMIQKKFFDSIFCKSNIKPQNFIRKHQNAFTMAEVLVTLGIVGIIAAMTLPALMTRYERKVLSTQAKKTYSTVMNMIRLAEAKNGPVKEWPEFAKGIVWYGRDGKFILESYLASQTNVNHIYTNGMEFVGGNMFQAFMCYTPGKTKLYKSSGGTLTEYVHMNGGAWGIHRNKKIYSMSLSDGSCVGLNATSIDLTKNIIGEVYIDVNGSDKGPNILGRDLFIFNLFENGMLLPVGNEISLEELISSRGSCGSTVFSTSNGCGAVLMKLNWDMNNPLYPWVRMRIKGVTKEELNP